MTGRRLAWGEAEGVLTSILKREVRHSGCLDLQMLAVGRISGKNRGFVLFSRHRPFGGGLLRSLGLGKSSTDNGRHRLLKRPVFVGMASGRARLGLNPGGQRVSRIGLVAPSHPLSLLVF